MANFESIMPTVNFEAKSLDDYLKPMMLYDQAYKQREAELDELDKSMAAFAPYAANAGGEAQEMYDTTLGAIKANADKLGQHGFLKDRESLRQLKKQYHNTSNILTAAATAQQEARKAEDALRQRDETLTASYVDANGNTVDIGNINAFMNNAHPTMAAAYGSKFEAEGEAQAKALSAQLTHSSDDVTYVTGPDGSLYMQTKSGKQKGLPAGKYSVKELLANPELLSKYYDTEADAPGAIIRLKEAWENFKNSNNYGSQTVENKEKLLNSFMTGVNRGLSYDEQWNTHMQQLNKGTTGDVQIDASPYSATTTRVTYGGRMDEENEGEEINGPASDWVPISYTKKDENGNPAETVETIETTEESKLIQQIRDAEKKLNEMQAAYDALPEYNKNNASQNSYLVNLGKAQTNLSYLQARLKDEREKKNARVKSAKYMGGCDAGNVFMKEAIDQLQAVTVTKADVVDGLADDKAQKALKNNLAYLINMTTNLNGTGEDIETDGVENFTGCYSYNMNGTKTILSRKQANDIVGNMVTVTPMITPEAGLVYQVIYKDDKNNNQSIRIATNGVPKEDAKTRMFTMSEAACRDFSEAGCAEAAYLPYAEAQQTIATTVFEKLIKQSNGDYSDPITIADASMLTADEDGIVDIESAPDINKIAMSINPATGHGPDGWSVAIKDGTKIYTRTIITQMPVDSTDAKYRFEKPNIIKICFDDKGNFLNFGSSYELIHNDDTHKMAYNMMTRKIATSMVKEFRTSGQLE